MKAIHYLGILAAIALVAAYFFNVYLEKSRGCVVAQKRELTKAVSSYQKAISELNKILALEKEIKKIKVDLPNEKEANLLFQKVKAAIAGYADIINFKKDKKNKHIYFKVNVSDLEEKNFKKVMDMVLNKYFITKLVKLKTFNQKYDARFEVYIPFKGM